MRQNGNLMMAGGVAAHAKLQQERPRAFVATNKVLVACGGAQKVLLVIDEIQKVPDWPNVVKSLWDADRRSSCPLKVFLSGSSSLLLHRGLEDSLTGRFELIRSPHWSLAECRDAFGFTLDDFLYYGGLPGAARFVHNDVRWSAYLRDAIIEPTISQDVLAFGDVRKPTLSDKGRERLLTEPDLRGHLVESAVGAYPHARAPGEGFEVCWWCGGNNEVDFVPQRGGALAAIEVKGGHETRRSGMATLLAAHPHARRIVVGGSSAGSCGLEEFLLGKVPLFYEDA